jgi:hypothetical protein
MEDAELDLQALSEGNVKDGGVHTGHQNQH